MKNSDVKQLSATHFSLIFGSSGAQFFGPAMTFTPQRPDSFTKATWRGVSEPPATIWLQPIWKVLVKLDHFPK